MIHSFQSLETSLSRYSREYNPLHRQYTIENTIVFYEEGSSRSGVVPTYVIGPENIVFYARTASLRRSSASNDNNRVKTRDKAIPEQAAELIHRERVVQVLAVRCAKSSNGGYSAELPANCHKFRAQDGILNVFRVAALMTQLALPATRWRNRSYP